MGITRVAHACAATLTAVSAGVASALVPGAAHADTTIVVNNYDFEDASAYVVRSGCDEPYTTTGNGARYVARSGPGSVPAGTRSWQFTIPDGESPFGPYFDDSYIRVPVVRMSYYATTDLTGVAYVIYSAPDLTGEFYVGRAELATTAAETWRVLDVSDLDYTWQRYTTPDPDQVDEAPEPVGSPEGTYTRAEFADLHGDGPAGYGIGLGCDGGVWSSDKWQIGTPDDLLTYDLEGVTATATMGRAPDRVTAGDPVKLTVQVLTGQLDDDGEPFPGNNRVDLEAQAADGTWETVRSVFPDAEGRASVTVKPERTTTYRWRAPATGAVEEATSETTTVAVRSAVTAKAPRAVEKGQAIAVRSDVVPGEGRPSVTLWRDGQGGPTSVDTARTKADGSFRLSTKAKGGKNRLYVTVPESDDTLAGRSKTLVVRGR